MGIKAKMIMIPKPIKTPLTMFQGSRSGLIDIDLHLYRS